MTFSLGVPTVSFLQIHNLRVLRFYISPEGWYNQTISGSYSFERVTSGRIQPVHLNQELND